MTKRTWLHYFRCRFFFAIGVILNHTIDNTLATFFVFAIAYVILGGEILVKAAKNISHGQVFDENFLMGVATLAAFAIRDFPEAVGVMLFYRIGEFFEDKAVERSRGQIMDAVDMRPEVVNLVSGNDTTVIPAEDANVGDILLIRPGDRIPLDGVVIEGESRLDTSPITGEPVPVGVSAGDEITSGCVNTSGQLKIACRKSRYLSLWFPVFWNLWRTLPQANRNLTVLLPDLQKGIHSLRRYCRCTCCRNPVPSKWKLELLDLHRNFLLSNELSLCSGIKCTAGILLRYRRRFQKKASCSKVVFLWNP